VIRKISIRRLLVVGFLAAGIIPILILSVIGFQAARSELKQQAFRQLESIRDIKREQIRNYFDRRRADIAVLGANPFLTEAFKNLESAFNQGREGTGVPFEGFGDGHFSAPPAYQLVHRRYSGFFDRFIRQYSYYDLMLLDIQRGHLVFTSRKEEDFGIRIDDVSSSLRDVWLAVKATGNITLSDTRPYPFSGNAPAQFLAGPVEDNGAVIGVVAVQISVDSINRIMSERSGLGQTGETYLVGRDQSLRSNSLVGRTFDGAVDTVAFREAFAGGVDSKIIGNYIGRRVLSAFAPVELLGIRWAIIAEIQEREIDRRIGEVLNRQIFLLLVVSFVLVLLFALVVSSSIGKGIQQIVRELENMMRDVVAGKLDVRGDPESVGGDFKGVVRRTNELVDTLAVQMDEKRKLEEHMQFTQRLEAIGTLAGGIAHDFNNILTSMFAYAEIINSELPEDSHLKENLDQLVFSIRRGTALVRQILMFSRQVKPEKKPVRVCAVVSETVKLLEVTLPKSIVIKYNVIPEDLWIKADPSQIHQVLINLSTNAYHAMKDTGGTLTVTGVKQDFRRRTLPGLSKGMYCKITVKDSGHGIARHLHSRIFDPFFSTKPVGEGTGMGLSLVHGIVTGYGGIVLVDSTPGQGSVFDVYLPLLQVSEHPVPEAELDESRFRGSGRILFVDDEYQICAAEKELMESYGYSVTTSTGSIEAELLFSRAPENFDVVVIDLNMPRMNGIQLARKILAVRPGVPVVLTTGYSELLDAGQMHEIGIRDLLLKPYEKRELLEVISGILHPEKFT
jgi:signal transduction histidine kinase